jgi:hypothetical protein
LAIVFESDALNEASATTVVVTKPSGTVDGDLLVAFWIVRANASDSNLTLPSGWTQVAFDGGQNPTIKLAYKVASGEGTNYTFTTNASRLQGAWIGRFSGVDTGSPSDATPNTNVLLSVSSVTVTSITTTTNGAFVLGFGGTPNSENYDITQPSGFTVMEDFIGISYVNINASYSEQATAGATGDKTWTTPIATTGFACALWAIKPSSVAAASLALTRKPNTLRRL